MSENFIPLSVPNFVGNEAKYTAETVAGGWVSTGGAMITEFENRIKNYVHCKAAAACQNGTSGLHLSLLALGVAPGDEVLVPALTFIAAINPVKYCNAEPVFMDCGDDLCMDLDKVDRYCREECVFREGKLYNKQTNAHVSAMVLVHVFGNICDMEKALSLAKNYNIRVIEDATEALGSRFTEGKYAGQYAGTMGDVGVFSFNGNKIITTGGGGMVVSNNSATVEYVRYLSTQAKDDVLRFVHNHIGYNYRMTNVQAALGVAQMENLDEFVKIKNCNYDLYQKNGIKLLPFQDNVASNKWFYSFMTADAAERDALIDFLKKHQIDSRPIWTLICDLPMYKDNVRYMIEKAKFYQDRIVNVPCSTGLSADDVRRVADTIRLFYGVQHE